ncbi:Phenylalanyl-tRNA synthetase alpha chain [hydrothermal vent metagenome]|uniref:Phenylalanine--tRNA ligase alpha subunit n=1 Tax=hydrothermal vent metagenome TaxID=652676 RepID=A0A1W1C236_9ZZZZ
MINIKDLDNEIIKDSLDINDFKSLEDFRISFLGKKGKITNALKELSNIPAEQRKSFAKEINILKSKVSKIVIEKKEAIESFILEKKIIAESVDVTVPSIISNIGGRHPVSQTITKIEELFKVKGFSIEEGPEIEDDFHNFTALNIPEHHPARAMHDTFYFNENTVLRTHTSPVQIRTLEKKSPPLRIIAPGKVYRCDSDITHTPMFHQIEGLLVEKDINFSVDKTLKVRFRPSYFPFTEPSAEVDISCVICKGKGCRVCKKTGYLEVLGCGVVHPNVLKSIKIDDNYSALAFGMGVERMAMLKYGIKDLRLFFESDIRFLRQFR